MCSAGTASASPRYHAAVPVPSGGCRAGRLRRVRYDDFKPKGFRPAECCLPDQSDVNCARFPGPVRRRLAGRSDESGTRQQPFLPSRTPLREPSRGQVFPVSRSGKSHPVCRRQLVHARATGFLRGTLRQHPAPVAHFRRCVQCAGVSPEGTESFRSLCIPTSFRFGKGLSLHAIRATTPCMSGPGM